MPKRRCATTILGVNPSTMATKYRPDLERKEAKKANRKLQPFSNGFRSFWSNFFPRHYGQEKATKIAQNGPFPLPVFDAIFGGTLRTLPRSIATHTYLVTTCSPSTPPLFPHHHSSNQPFIHVRFLLDFLEAPIISLSLFGGGRIQKKGQSGLKSSTFSPLCPANPLRAPVLPSRGKKHFLLPKS